MTRPEAGFPANLQTDSDRVSGEFRKNGRGFPKTFLEPASYAGFQRCSCITALPLAAYSQKQREPFARCIWLSFSYSDFSLRSFKDRSSFRGEGSAERVSRGEGEALTAALSRSASLSLMADPAAEFGAERPGAERKIQQPGRHEAKPGCRGFPCSRGARKR